MATTDYKYACAVCGDDSFLFRQMTPIGDGKYACPFDARGFSDADLRGKNDLAKLWPAIKPRRNPGSESSVIPLYRKAEAEVLNLLLAYGGTGVPPYRHWAFRGPVSQLRRRDGGGDGYVRSTYDGSASSELRVELDTCAWTAIYLYELLTEDHRPNVWITSATTKFRAMADTLLENQLGSPFLRAALVSKFGAVAETALNWGGVIRNVQFLPVSQVEDEDEGNATLSATSGDVHTTTMGVAGMALLRAYQFFGDAKYRQGYLRIATWLHRTLYLNLFTSNWTTDAGGGRVRYATWPERLQQHVTVGGRDVRSQFVVEGLACLEFLAALRAQEGDIAIGSTVAVAEFALQPGTETISTVIADVKAFWRDGVMSFNTQQYYEDLPPAAQSGFNGTIPQEYLQVAQASGPFTPYWSETAADLVNSDRMVATTRFAHAMRGWYAAFGFDATLAAVWNLFMATTQTSALEIPDGTTKATLADTIMGPYTPASMGLSVFVTVQNWDDYTALNRVGMGVSAALDLSCLGLLADLWVAREPAGFALAKERACTAHRRRWTIGRDQRFDLPCLVRRVGFSYQTMPMATTTTPKWNNPGPVYPPTDPIDLTTYNFITDTWDIGSQNERSYDACGAAMFGLAFRRQPKIYSVKDHHPRHA